VKNFVSDSNPVTILAPKDLKSGEPFVLGSLVAFPYTDANTGDLVSVLTEGAVNVFPNANVNAGDVLYFHTATSLIDKTSTNGIPLGFALDGGLVGSAVRCLLSRTITLESKETK